MPTPRAGCVLSLTGAGLTSTAIAASLPTTDYGLLVSAGNVTRVVAASGFAGAAGATLGAGIGAIVRNVGGAVTSTVFTFFIAPPLIVQLANGTASWMPAAPAPPGLPVVRELRDRPTAPSAQWHRR